jgi:hypothetical protein
MSTKPCAHASVAPFGQDPTRPELERFFFLDDEDRRLIGKRRGDHSRLGFALQICSRRGSRLDCATQPGQGGGGGSRSSDQVDSVLRMASADRVARYQAMVDELTELIRTAGTSVFEAREQDILNRVHQEYFAAVADLSRSGD